MFLREEAKKNIAHINNTINKLYKYGTMRPSGGTFSSHLKEIREKMYVEEKKDKRKEAARKKTERKFNGSGTEAERVMDILENEQNAERLYV